MANFDEISDEQKATIIKEFERRLEALPEADRLGLLVCSPHLANGANWGFDGDTPGGNVREYLKLIEESGANEIITFKLNRGYVFDFLNFDKAVALFRSVAGSTIFSKKAEDGARKRRESSLASLQKFLSEGRAGTVGFFNTNASDTVTKDGKTYPSFALNARDFFGTLAQANYRITTATGTNASASQAFSNLRGVMEQLDKSPSSNAVMVRISPGK